MDELICKTEDEAKAILASRGLDCKTVVLTNRKQERADTNLVVRAVFLDQKTVELTFSPFIMR